MSTEMPICEHIATVSGRVEIPQIGRIDQAHDRSKCGGDFSFDFGTEIVGMWGGKPPQKERVLGCSPPRVPSG
jgi:hypothetical protein